MAAPHVAHHLHGIIPPMVTPLVDRAELDHAGLERWILAESVDAIREQITTVLDADAVRVTSPSPPDRA